MLEQSVNCAVLKFLIRVLNLLKQKEDAVYDLKGKTLQVYLYLMQKNAPSGIREIQRDLNLSSPSVANYQIEKLVDLELVGKDVHGRYYLLRKVQVPSLKAYVNLGRFMVPRLVFYAGFFTTLLGFYIILNFSSPNLFAVVFGSIGAAVFWYEAFRMWKMSPIAIHIDLPDLKPFIEKKTGLMPYLALGLIGILSATAGFNIFSNLVGGYVQNHPEIYDITSIDISSINTDTNTYPADKISESVSLARDKVNYATRDNAHGPGVPMISRNSFSTLMMILSFVAAVTAGLTSYVIVKSGCKDKILALEH